ncbi:hypothetical protein E2C01_087235 [Portunus trituberculatus]|uniref:Uncharacterized protein n=1 Tax=Portunus trituberculatus TaxID=210409 RepID=A0A5B7JCT0_PORTR|nr:hypothetical protein [Portunus trituberculatus]
MYETLHRSTRADLQPRLEEAKLSAADEMSGGAVRGLGDHALSRMTRGTGQQTSFTKAWIPYIINLDNDSDDEEDIFLDSGKN